ncbi:MAG: 2-C-methyl-D-erythritol 4-phosphate cytidylyltransferase [candidate division NC10 bacterium]|nr:2-C-methyl-D-erythritol 4-phosphate cytidylyltransferase [candidate division NC10 bacterium]MBI2116371.1 2-C-methyl-D-erythritol 4-phosphate cytidylyltransferase [candidate division NC10 bacterium]MBI2456393.1 2-C-methyl-D-erythritol 4-phosphate cytidylyltransferase [candidate division NC10 bacterium]MBI2564066.1 2-C-methyl-D-erythritol 4-phosphate cytidylyltransferase [candidate division NC10 bacterium]
MHVTAIVPAAGGGTRIAGTLPKQYLPLAGIPLLTRTLQALRASPRVDRLILVVPPGHEGRCRVEILEPFGLAVDAMVPGGEDRQASVYAGLQRASLDTDLILVHDGARPFISPAVIQAVVVAAAEAGAAVAAIPVTDTIKVAGPDGWLLETPDRGRLWAAQTPQVFRTALLREAHARALRDGLRSTDDSALVERLGHPVRLVPGSPENLKITTSADLALADQILRARDAEAGRAG